MAGRPRTMFRRVTRILERHKKLTQELRSLGKHYMPAPGEAWDLDLPAGDIALIPPLWRRAVRQAGRFHDDIEWLLTFLQVKAEKAEQAAKADEPDAVDDLEPEGDGQNEPATNDDVHEVSKTSEPLETEKAERPDG